MASLWSRNGLPPLRLRAEGVATLALLILQQQVSRASAAAVFARLEDLCGGAVTAEVLAELPTSKLREIGLSAGKADYMLGIAGAVAAGEVDLKQLSLLDDEVAMDTLRSLRGVGPWTAAVYALTALGRPDVWVPGDRALLVTLGKLLEMDDACSDDAAAALAEHWRPWRAVAARMIWDEYSVLEAR